MRNIADLQPEEYTADDIAELKYQWRNDPCWDIWEAFTGTPWEAELRAYQAECEAEWDRAYHERVNRKAAALNCSPELARHIMALEYQIDQLRGVLHAS